MDFFFEPKGIAVAGATAEPRSGGYHLFTNLSLGYRGPVYPVNPRYGEILGVRCYSRVTEIEGPLDLVLIFTPARAVPQVLEDCVAKGARGAIIQSGGFAEVGPEGKALQDRCLSIARRGNLRLWGPNCMGLIDTSTRYVFSFLNADSCRGLLNRGHISFIVQSGLLSAGFVITLMSKQTVGLAKVCSIGNKSDIEETEILEYLLKDPVTEVICLYLESFARGRRFIELAASSGKPIVLLKGGKSPSGAVAAASHTASLAGNHDLIQGAMKQAGIHPADDFFEMVDIARALEKGFLVQRSATSKPRIAVLSFSGAAGIVTTDHLEKLGLTLSPLSLPTRERLQELSPPWMPVKNPVDFWPAVEKHGPLTVFKHGLKALHDDPQVDGIIAHLYSGPGIWSIDMRELVSGVDVPRKPIFFWLLGPRENVEADRRGLEEAGFPVFEEIHRTARVMASLFESPPRAGEDEENDFGPLCLGPSVTRSLSALIRQADQGRSNVQDEHESKQWLKALDLKVVEERLAQGLDEVLEGAREIGYPVVLKGRLRGTIHKTEAGLVRLNLSTEEQLRAAYAEMDGLPLKPQSFLVQPMLRGDFELIIGMNRDPQFGPAVMLGLGGLWTEIYRDVAFRLAPLTPQEVRGMVSELKGHALFEGFRGSRPVNLEALAGCLIKIGWLALTVDQIQEMDVNPLLIVEGEPVAVDATIILR